MVHRGFVLSLDRFMTHGSHLACYISSNRIATVVPFELFGFLFVVIFCCSSSLSHSDDLFCDLFIYSRYLNTCLTRSSL